MVHHVPPWFTPHRSTDQAGLVHPAPTRGQAATEGQRGL